MKIFNFTLPLIIGKQSKDIQPDAIKKDGRV